MWSQKYLQQRRLITITLKVFAKSFKLRVLIHLKLIVMAKNSGGFAPFWVNVPSFVRTASGSTISCVGRVCVKVTSTGVIPCHMGVSTRTLTSRVTWETRISTGACVLLIICANDVTKCLCCCVRLLQVLVAGKSDTSHVWWRMFWALEGLEGERAFVVALCHTGQAILIFLRIKHCFRTLPKQLEMGLYSCQCAPKQNKTGYSRLIVYWPSVKGVKVIARNMSQRAKCRKPERKQNIKNVFDKTIF